MLWWRQPLPLTTVLADDRGHWQPGATGKRLRAGYGDDKLDYR